MSNWIERHLSHMRACGLAENTIEDRRDVLRRLDEDLPMGLVEATVEELEEWLSRPRRDSPVTVWTNQTKATYYGHINGFFRWASDPNRYPHLSYDPSASLNRPKVPQTLPRPVEDEEIAQILDVTEGRWRVYTLLAAYAGQRCCQIANMDRSDITAETIRVRGKGGKETVVPTHPIIWDAVRNLPPGPIALTPDGRRGDAKYVSRRTTQYLERRLGKHITLHRLRHWFATTTLASGANLRVVQELLGHASPATTAIYTKVTNEQRRLAVEALPVLAPPAS